MGWGVYLRSRSATRSATAFSWWSIGAGVHVEPHSHPNEQIVWNRLGSEQRVCDQGDVIVIPGGTEHEAWFREDSEVITWSSIRAIAVTIMPTRRAVC